MLGCTPIHLRQSKGERGSTTLTVGRRCSRGHHSVDSRSGRRRPWRSPVLAPRRARLLDVVLQGGNFSSMLLRVELVGGVVLGISTRGRGSRGVGVQLLGGSLGQTPASRCGDLQLQIGVSSFGGRSTPPSLLPPSSLLLSRWTGTTSPRAEANWELRLGIGFL